jgi:hypothetical protein
MMMLLLSFSCKHQIRDISFVCGASSPLPLSSVVSFDFHIKLGFETYRRPSIEQFTPIAGLSCWREISVTEDCNAVVGDVFGFVIVFDIVFYFRFEITEVSLDGYYVLIGAFGFKKMGMWFDPVGCVYH